MEGMWDRPKVGSQDQFCLVVANVRKRISWELGSVCLDKLGYRWQLR
jgi:hypothetical protein